jgi:hypothetical protein
MAVISALPVQFCEPWFTTEPRLHRWDGADVYDDEAGEAGEAGEPTSSS